MGLAKLTYVTGPDEPCNVSGEVRPPKVVDDVCTCGKVSVMPGGVVSRSKNCWSFVTVDDYFMTMICLGCNKDLWSRRSKYKSYGALRGCGMGVRDCLQVYCGK